MTSEPIVRRPTRRNPTPPVGTQFGSWTVIGEPIPPKPDRKDWWRVRVQCACGAERDVIIAYVHTLTMCRSCVLRRAHAVKRESKAPSVGTRFGAWTVIGEAVVERRAKVPARCDCRREALLLLADLLAGRSKQCNGCARRNSAFRNVLSQRQTTHGGSRTRLYKVWRGMLARCEKPQHQAYPRYGARGIRVCDEWHDFAIFRDWAHGRGFADDGLPFGPQTLTIDRLDPDGDYEPSNCEWVTLSENARRSARHHAALKAAS